MTLNHLPTTGLGNPSLPHPLGCGWLLGCFICKMLINWSLSLIELLETGRNNAYQITQFGARLTLSK